MKQTPFSLGLIALMMSASIAVEPETTVALVAKGQKLYSGQEYDLAAEAFRSAIELESCPATVHYMLACSLAMNTPDRRKWDEVFETACDALERAIKLDPGTARKAATDLDFIHIRLTPRFQKLIGADLQDKELVNLMLVANSIWYHPPHGTWNGNDLLFMETGEVKRRMFVIDEHDKNIIRFENGRYAVDQKGDITVTCESGEELSGRFTEDGTLELKGGKTTNYTCYPIHDV